MFSRSLFFTAAHFHLALVAASICHRRYKIFMLFFRQKKMPPLFLSLALHLSRPFSR